MLDKLKSKFIYVYEMGTNLQGAEINGREIVRQRNINLYRKLVLKRCGSRRDGDVHVVSGVVDVGKRIGVNLPNNPMSDKGGIAL